MLMFIVVVASLSSRGTVPLVHTRMPKPRTSGLMPGTERATQVLCKVCFMLATTRIIFLLFNKVGLCSTLLRTFDATKAKKFSGETTDIDFCSDTCVSNIVAMFVVLFKVGFGLCFFVLLGS